MKGTTVRIGRIRRPVTQLFLMAVACKQNLEEGGRAGGGVATDLENNLLSRNSKQSSFFIIK